MRKKFIVAAVAFSLIGMTTQAATIEPVKEVKELSIPAADKIKELAAQIKAQYAPDKRTAWFELTEDEQNPGQFHIETTVPEAKVAFEQALAQAGVSAKVNFRVLPDETVGDKQKAIVRLSVVDIRYTPANQAEMVTQAVLGTAVDLLKKRNGYYLVRTPEGYIAWLKDSSLATMTSDQYTAWQRADKLMFTDDFGHAYTEPSTKSLRVSDLVMGNILALDGVESGSVELGSVESGEERGFYAVSYPDGRKAYIPTDQAVPYAQWLAETEL